MSFATDLQTALDAHAPNQPTELMNMIARARSYLSYLERYAHVPGCFEQRGLLSVHLRMPRLAGDERARVQAAFIRTSTVLLDCAEHWLETGERVTLPELSTDDLATGWAIYAGDLRIAALNVGAVHHDTEIAQRWHWLIDNYIESYFGKLHRYKDS